MSSLQQFDPSPLSSQPEPRPPPEPNPDAFLPVPRYPGVVSCPQLEELYLGVTVELDLLCCIHCPRLHTLNFSTCHKHVHQHLGPERVRQISTNWIRDVCKKYKVYQGLLTSLPVPALPVKPFPFLPMRKAVKCILCADEGFVYIGLSDGHRRNHFTQAHKPYVSQRVEYEEDVTVQTFAPQSTDARWFVVLPELADALDIDEESRFLPSSDELFEAYVRWWKPLTSAPVEGLSLKDTQPFIWFSGWAAHVKDHDPMFLCSLVEAPTPGTEYDRIFQAAKREFRKDQQSLSSIHEVYRINIMDDGSGTPDHAFKALLAQSSEQYGRSLGIFWVFVLRVWRMQKSGDTRYPVHFTPRQDECLQYALEYCQHAPDRIRAVDLFSKLSHAFWLPEAANDFAHISEDQFNEPTARYGILVNLNPNGTFKDPRTSAHNLVQLKYFMRHGLFLWARRQFNSMAEKPHAMWTVDIIAPGLTRRAISPFASICVAVAHATIYANTSVQMPNVNWISPRRLVVEGHTIDFDEYRTAVGGLIERAEREVLEDVLFGVPPEEAGFDVGYDTHIYDNYGCTRPKYSFLSDPRNSFIQMQHMLPRKLFESGKAGVLHNGLADNKLTILWKRKGIDDWLNSCSRATKTLAICLYCIGGGPGRGTEVTILDFVNMGFRIRGVFYRNPGTLVFVLAYNKSTSNTGYDRIVAHALPWRVTRLFLIMLALVNPMQGMLLESFSSIEDREVQATALFALRGKKMRSEQLSKSLNAWIKGSPVGADMGLSEFRHFFIACQKQFMPEAFTASRKAMSILDAQAGHTSEIAESHYAINADETHLLSETTVLKEIAASARWWVVTLPEAYLNPEERTAGTKLLKGLSRSSGGDGTEESGGAMSIETAIATVAALAPALGPALAQELAKAMEPTAVMSMLVDKLSALCTSATTPANPDVASSTPVPELSSPKRSDTDAVSLNAADLRQSLNQASASLHQAAADAAAPPQVQRDGGSRLHLPYVPARSYNDVASVKHLALLRRYTGDDNATFSSPGQGKALVRTLLRQNSLLVVLPTGGGKSLLFASMPLIEAGITVVVFPLRALALDQMESARAKGIPMVEWEPRLQAPNPSIVSVCVEKAGMNARFIEWAYEEAGNRNLNRIVLEEVHLALLSKDYRQSVNHLDRLLDLAVPILAITATGPPALEGQLHQHLGRPSWSVVREPTQRANLHLRTAKFGSEEAALDSLVRHVRRYESQLDVGDGILVVCRSYVDVEKVSARLKVPAYTSKIENTVRDIRSRDWITGKFSTIVGTSGLGTGVNHSRCRVVIHWGPPYGMIQYAQETGRAGRGRFPALAILFHWKPRFGPPEEDVGGWYPLAQMLDSVECMRSHMSLYLDGRELQTSCAASGFAMCGKCVESMKRASRRGGFHLAGPDEADMEEGIPLFGPGDWVELDLPKACSDVSVKLAPTTQVDSAPGDSMDIDTPPLDVFSPATNVDLVSGLLNTEDQHEPPDVVAQAIQRRQLDMALVRPPLPMGPSFQRDADERRRQMKADHERELELEAPNAPYNVPCLLDAKAELADRECPHCLVHGDLLLRHKLEDCTVSPSTRWDLTGHIADRQLFLDARKSGKIKYGANICYWCYWPGRVDHVAPSGVKGQAPDCAVKDRVMQICWIAFCDLDVRRQIAGEFSRGEGWTTPSAYMIWIFTTHRLVRWGKESFAILNAHRVVLYIMYKMRGIL